MNIILIIAEMLSKIDCIGPWDLRFYIGFISLLPFYLIIALVIGVSVIFLNKREHDH